MSYNQPNLVDRPPATTSCSLNRTFVQSPPGILKALEMVIDIVIWICVGSSLLAASSNGGFINFAATISFIFTVILYILYLIQLIHRLPGPWILIECGSILVSIFFLAIAMLIGALSYSLGGGAIAASVFCALNAVVYGIEMFLRFRIHKSNGWNFTVTSVDGDISTKQTTTTTVETTTGQDKPTGQGEFGDSYGVP